MRLNRSRIAVAPASDFPPSAISARQAPGETKTVAWLPRSRRVQRKPGDLLVVLLSSAIIILLGLVAVILRFGSAVEASAPSPAAVAQQAQQQASRPRPAAAPVPAPAPAPAAATAPTAMRASVPAGALAAAPVAATGGVTPAAPIADQPPGLAFAAVAPRLATPVPEPAPIPAPAPRLARVDPETGALAPTPPARPANLRAEPKTEARATPQQRPEAAPQAPQGQQSQQAPQGQQSQQAQQAEPALRRGGAGAAWAVYFDRFPDQKSVAAQINALQGKYGAHLGGRRLTYARAADDSWRVRVAGLTEEAAGEICEKVRKTGGACAIGGR